MADEPANRILSETQLKLLAANGEDFAALRSDPRWQELIDV